jgi:hypothetical protein
MKMNKLLQSLLGSILGTALACLLILAASGQTTEQAGQSRKAARRAAAAEAGVDLPNFGRINDHYFRGAQPLARQYDDLKAIGVKTITGKESDRGGAYEAFGQSQIDDHQAGAGAGAGVSIGVG